MHKPNTAVQHRKPSIPTNRPFQNLKNEVVTKRNVLFIFGVGDTFCYKDSHKFLKAGEKILTDVSNLIEEDKKKYFGYINLLEFNDHNKKVNPLKNAKASKVIDFRMYDQKVFSKQNFMSLTGVDGVADITMEAQNLPFVLPPEDFNIFICGIDINGAFMNTIDSLITEGYHVTVFSDIIKPYSKETIEYLINKSKDRANYLRFGKS
jgi:hypothetical protein